MFDSLDSETPAVREAAMTEALKVRKEAATRAAELIERYHADPQRQGTVKDCLLLLGHLGANEHVALLVHHLTFEAYYKNTKRPQTTEDLYPASAALAELGPSALPAVLDRLRGEDGETLARAGAAALAGALGRHYALVILDDELRRATGPAHARLEAVKQQLDKR